MSGNWQRGKPDVVLAGQPYRAETGFDLAGGVGQEIAVPILSG